MDDAMFELTAGNVMLRRRMDAYAEVRLSPDAAASANIRARVMAAAHKQAALTAAGAGLTVVADVPTTMARVAARRAPARSRRSARLASVMLAASLAMLAAAGSTMAAAAGGPLYEARLGLESLFLPTEPPARAVAELTRLEARLAEIADASARGDARALDAALRAYATIVDTAVAEAIVADDPVASAALRAGIARNIVVLEALLDRAPEAATDGLDRAIERSGVAIDDIEKGRNGNGGGPTEPGSPPDPGGRPAVTPRPTRDPAPTPKASDELTAEPTSTPTEKPGRTPKPDKTPPGQAPEEPSAPDRAPRVGG